MIAKFFWLCVGSILYTYAGYPLLLALLSRRRPKPQPYPFHTPSVTLLITAYNEEQIIGDKIENALALDYPRDCLQILVADDGSVDRTAEIVRSFAARGVELVQHPPRRGKLAALNRAVPDARGDILMFSDASNFYNREMLQEIVRPFADPTVGAVSGAKVVRRGDGVLGESEGAYWKYESFIKEQETRLGCCTSATGEILAIRSELFEPPPDHIINEDFFIGMQIVRRGYRIVYAPRARSSERVSASAQAEVERRARIIAGRYQALAEWQRLLPFHRPGLVWQVVSHKFLRPFVPFAMAGALLANGLAVLRPSRPGRLWLLGQPFNWIFLALQLLFYASAWLGNRMERAGQSKLPFYLYLPTFLVNSNLAAVIGLYRFLTRRQSTLWARTPRRDVARGGSQAA